MICSYVIVSRPSRISAVSLDNDVRQVLEICKGDVMAALRMVLIANANPPSKTRSLCRIWARQGAETGEEEGRLKFIEP
jgi:hypothetical protein